MFRLPEPLIDRQVATIPGLDGRKMSKSYGNVVPIFASPGELRALIGRIVTDSRAAQEPKDPERCTLFALYRHLAQPAAVAALRARYLEGGVAYRQVKEELAGLLEAGFGPARIAYQALMADPAELDRLVAAGAERARERATPVLDRVRAAVGLGSVGRVSAQAVD